MSERQLKSTPEKWIYANRLEDHPIGMMALSLIRVFETFKSILLPHDPKRKPT